jgi:hypothetical protein
LSLWGSAGLLVSKFFVVFLAIAGRAQAGERLEHAAVVGNLGVADHWGFLCWSYLQCSTGGSITDLTPAPAAQTPQTRELQ